jgi:hypothetical protein
LTIDIGPVAPSRPVAWSIPGTPMRALLAGGGSDVGAPDGRMPSESNSGTSVTV